MCSNHFALDERQGTILARDAICVDSCIITICKSFFNVILHMFHNKNVNTYTFSFRYCILMQYCSVKIKNNIIIIFNTGNVFSLGPTSIGFYHEIIKLKRQSFKSSMNSDIDTNHL